MTTGASNGDVDAIALTLWGEGRGELVDGRIAIACVLRNRLQLGRWGRSYESVVHAPMQFSCWQPIGGAGNFQALQRLAGELARGVTPADPVLVENLWIADGLMSGRLRDRVKGATHYHVIDLDPLPPWAKGHVPVVRVGAHVFYQGIR